MEIITLSDIIILALLLVSSLYGWRKGTIKVISGAAGWIIGYQLARYCSGKIAAYMVGLIPPFSGANDADLLLKLLSLFIDTSGMVNHLLELILFIIIFIVVAWLIRKLARIMTGAFGKGVLAKINKALGLLLALLLMAAVIGIFINIILPACVSMGFGESWLAFFSNSVIMYPLFSSLGGLL